MTEPQSTSNSPPVLPDDQLPPVEPPSAGFILQLFVVPGVIVAAIVAVWFMFSWIAHSASARPEDIAQGLEGSGPARWQRASELADMLRNDRYPDFRKSSAAASRVAEILDREILSATTAGGMDDGSVNLRYFLCRALGEFEVTDGLDVLLKAATTNRDTREQWVRRGAIQAIAVMAYQQLHGDLSDELPGDLNSDLNSASFDPATVEATLLELAGDEDDLIRSEVAFALGRVATPVCLQRLETMADDPHADTRYNAAVGLAQHGNASAMETLTEMLEFDSSFNIDGELNAQSKLIKRAIIMKNAMGAIVTLAKSAAETDTSTDFSTVQIALKAILDASPDTLREASVDPMVQSEAKRTLDFLQRHEGDD